MKVVIELSDEDYTRIKMLPDVFDSLMSRLYTAVNNGTPLPEHHGRLIDADAYINSHSLFGWLNDIEVNDFNEITPTIIEGSESE